MESSSSKKKKVVAISSGGGHWVQLNRLRPAFDDCDLTFATVKESYRDEIEGANFTVIPDSNRSNKFKLLKSAVGILLTLLKIRPDVVISTGAAPGYFAVRIGKLLGAKTIWVDSIANAEVLSLSGQKAGKHVDLWLTQWPHLAKKGGPEYVGNVL
ncbi:UDP-N-acetylglucosamine transferase subunit ALG14 [Puniceicoccaceae bacterium K14]|nr:UDP-N-acetylglucosamine transferase subunit ALG14 [Puniceicoccaceae bacterium K14]